MWQLRLEYKVDTYYTGILAISLCCIGGDFSRQIGEKKLNKWAFVSK